MLVVVTSHLSPFCLYAHWTATISILQKDQNEILDVVAQPIDFY